MKVKKGVGSLSLCLRLSSETQVSIFQRRSLYLCYGQAESFIYPRSPPSGMKAPLTSGVGEAAAGMETCNCICCVLLSPPAQLDESPFVNGKITHKIKVVPTANLTVSCTVSNDFGMDTRTINVSSCKYKEMVPPSRPSSLPVSPEAQLTALWGFFCFPTLLIDFAC